MNYSSRVGVLAGTAIAATLLAACATTPPKVEAYKAMPMGSTWTYSQHNSGSYAAQLGGSELKVQGTVGERTWEGRKVLAFSGSQGTIVTEPEPSGLWLAILGPGDKPFVRWDPPLGYEWPVEVGRTWTKNHRLTLVTGQTVPIDVSCKVQSYEDVVVPAGTFPAFKVACSFSTGLEEITWFSPEFGIFVKTSDIRGANFRDGPGTQQQELFSLNVKK